MKYTAGDLLKAMVHTGEEIPYEQYKEFKASLMGVDKYNLKALSSKTLIGAIADLGADEFLARFKNRFRRYITNDEIHALSTVVSLFLDCDRDIARAIKDFEHNLVFDSNNDVYFDLRKEE